MSFLSRRASMSLLTRSSTRRAVGSFARRAFPGLVIWLARTAPEFSVEAWERARIVTRRAPPEAADRPNLCLITFRVIQLVVQALIPLNGTPWGSTEAATCDTSRSCGRAATRRFPGHHRAHSVRTPYRSSRDPLSRLEPSRATGGRTGPAASRLNASALRPSPKPRTHPDASVGPSSCPPGASESAPLRAGSSSRRNPSSRPSPLHRVGRQDHLGPCPDNY